MLSTKATFCLNHRLLTSTGAYSWINDITPADAPDWLLTAKSDRLKENHPETSIASQVFAPRTSLDPSRLKAEASQGINWHSNVLRLVGHMIANGAQTSRFMQLRMP